eukprot:775333-Pleurochrysis_carterae.AAC.3
MSRTLSKRPGTTISCLGMKQRSCATPSRPVWPPQCVKTTEVANSSRSDPQGVSHVPASRGTSQILHLPGQVSGVHLTQEPRESASALDTRWCPRGAIWQTTYARENACVPEARTRRCKGWRGMRERVALTDLQTHHSFSKLAHNQSPNRVGGTCKSHAGTPLCRYNC